MLKFREILILLVCSTGWVKADWHLAWEDQFDGADLHQRWNFETGCNGFGNNELQCYTDNRAENAHQENGILTITARKEPWEDKQFTSTRMFTKDNWLHGKFEMRARLPLGKHLWPAFWMMPAHSEYGGWPSSGEIDIMEYRGQRPNVNLGTLHFGASPDNKGMLSSNDVPFNFDFSQDFHVFAVDWSPVEVKWMVDDQVFHMESLQRNLFPSFYQADGQPFDKNFYIIVNLAVGGNFFGGEHFDPSEADGWQKNTYEIDWIRKWEWQ